MNQKISHMREQRTQNLYMDEIASNMCLETEVEC